MRVSSNWNENKEMNTNKSIYSIQKWIPPILAFSLIAILLAACGQSAGQVVSSPQPTVVPTDNNTAPAVSAAKSALAEKLNISVDTIQLMGAKPVQWPDTCLGVQTTGVMCAFHVVDGYRIILSVNNQTYEAHSNLDGSQIVLVPGPVSPSAGQS